MTDERTINPCQSTALSSAAKPCYHRSMVSEESVLDAALRIKAKMESYGYTPTLEEIVTSVERTRKKHGVEGLRAAEERRQAVLRSIDQAERDGAVTERQILHTRKCCAMDLQEDLAWVWHLLRKAKDEGRTDRDVNREFDIKVRGFSFPKAVLRVVKRRAA